MEKYLKPILNLMDSSETICAVLQPMQDELDSFEHTKRFCRKFRIQLFDQADGVRSGPEAYRGF